MSKKAKLLKGMDRFIRYNISDEELFEDWLALGVPDEHTDEDLEFIAGDPELYNDCVELFARLVIADSKN